MVNRSLSVVDITAASTITAKILQIKRLPKACSIPYINAKSCAFDGFGEYKRAFNLQHAHGEPCEFHEKHHDNIEHEGDQRRPSEVPILLRCQHIVDNVRRNGKADGEQQPKREEEFGRGKGITGIDGGGIPWLHHVRIHACEYFVDVGKTTRFQNREIGERSSKAVEFRTPY